MEEPRENQRWVSLRTAAQKMLRTTVCLPQGAILTLDIFMQFLLVDRYVKQKVNGESSSPESASLY
jgi:hypothetical protein